VEVVRGNRLLRCSYCAAAWRTPRAACVYCGNADDRFAAAVTDMARPDRRIEMCGACGGYTKVLEVDAPAPFPLLAIEDLATLSLDQAAMSLGYARPNLPDLDAIDPRPGC
jgi:FdhE protein